MAEILSVPPAELRLHNENPRLPLPNVGERETLRELAGELKQKLLALATDIVEHGLNPSELPIVMPAEGETGYIVLEGNRRIAAIKILEGPDTIEGAVPPTLLRKFKALSAKYQKDPILEVDCCVVSGRSEADHWLEVRHTGERGGAGVVPWNSQEIARFRARRGEAPTASVQALNMIAKHRHMSADECRKVPITSLERLLTTKAVRDRLGVVKEEGKLLLLGREKDVAKSLAFVADKLISELKVGDIYTREQREKFAKRIPKVPYSKGAAPTAPTGTSSRPPGSSTATKRRKAESRTPLIPPDCTLNITHERVREIEEELRTLNVYRYPNAVCVLFRVFVELSVDEYIEQRELIAPDKLDNEKLRNKIQVTVKDLVARKKLSKRQSQPVRQFLVKNSLLLPSVDLMHSYIHNQHVFPAGADLLTSWKGLQPFVVAIWAP